LVQTPPYLAHIEHKHPTDPNLELEQIQVITRHGVRTPLSRYPHPYDKTEWQCDNLQEKINDLLISRGGEPPVSYNQFEAEKMTRRNEAGNCYMGQLTAKGLKDVKKTGEYLRQRYVEEYKLLPSKLDLNALWIRSTDSKRTIETAYTILSGLYPLNTRSEGQILTVNIFDRASENMYPRHSCTKVHQAVKDLKAAPQQLERQEKIRKMFCGGAESEEEQKECSVWAKKELQALFNTLYSAIYHDFPLPKNISPGDVHNMGLLSGQEYADLFGSHEISRLGIGRFVKNLTDVLHEQIETPIHEMQVKPKMYLYSGHDNTLSPMLNAFKVFDNKHPDMGAFIVWELWKNKATNKRFVKFIYNHHEVIPNGCDRTLCPVEDFLKTAKDLIPVNYEEECGGFRK
jgi:broad specificity phosphatase PhoE